MPSPARVPVQVTGMLVVPENVHTGSPPFLKCGLEAKATDTARTSISIASNDAIANRRMVILLSSTMETQSNSAHMHTASYFNMEALQATKVLAHYEHMVEKHALQSSSTTTRPIAQEEVVQNRYRGKYPGMGGKYLRIILFSLYLKKYTFFTLYQYRKVDALRNTREVVQCYVPIEGA